MQPPRCSLCLDSNTLAILNLHPFRSSVGRLSVSFLFGLLLSGCTSSAMIRELQEDRVIVQATNPDPAQVRAEANRGCAFHGRTAVPVSQQCVDAFCNIQTFLFACEGPVGRSSPWLGLSVADVPDHRFADPPGSSEVVISRIFADGPAKIAGFRVGDIIESFKGVPVSNSGQLADLKRNVRGGEKIHVSIRRGTSRLRLAMRVE